MLSDGEANGGRNVTLNPVNLSAAFDELDENAHESTSGSDATSEPVGDAQSRNDAVAESATGSEQANADCHLDSAASTNQKGLAAETEDVVSVPLSRLLELERTGQQLAVYLTDPAALRKLAEYQAAIQQLIEATKLRTDEKANGNSAETSTPSKTQRGPGYGGLVTDSDAETDDDSDLPVRNVVIDWDEDTDLDEYLQAKMEFQRNFAERRRKDEQEFGPTERFPLWPRVHVEFEEEFEEES
ncbi:hypothetical protein AAVH_19660 [Aphelenchoides avenae]|nr:hypothetical protein AAVH_19660 [Aphelenchus avenae]